MKKHSYRQTDVNKIDWSALKNKTQGRGLMFCVDVAKQNFVGVLASLEGEVVCVVKWKHPQDTAGLVEKLCTGLGAARLEVVMEPSGTYGDVLRWQFSQRGIQVTVSAPSRCMTGRKATTECRVCMTRRRRTLSPNCTGKGTAHYGRKRWQSSAACKGWPGNWKSSNRCIGPTLRQAQGRPEPPVGTDGAALAGVGICSGSVVGERVEAVGGVWRAVRSDALKLCRRVRMHEEQAAALLEQEGGHFLKQEKRQAILGAAQNSLGVPCTPGAPFGRLRAGIKALAQDLLRTHRASLEVEKRMAQAVKSGGDEEMSKLAEFTGQVTCVILTAILGTSGNTPTQPVCSKPWA